MTSKLQISDFLVNIDKSAIIFFRLLQKKFKVGIFGRDSRVTADIHILFGLKQRLTQGCYPQGSYVRLTDFANINSTYRKKNLTEKKISEVLTIEIHWE